MKKKKHTVPRVPRIKPPKDQLLVHDGLSMTVRRKRRFPEMLIRILITLCGSAADRIFRCILIQLLFR